MEENWFIRQSKKEAEDILANTKMTSRTKRELLGMLAARVDGYSLALQAQPSLFRTCCDFRNMIRRWRDEIF